MSVPARFVHIGFNFTGTPPIDALAEKFKAALDWLRYDYSCWLLYTNTELDIWRDRIRGTPGVQKEDSFFLCEFDPKGYSGYMHQWAWDWLKKDRSVK
jgi:hypothetical protein